MQKPSTIGMMASFQTLLFWVNEVFAEAQIK